MRARRDVGLRGGGAAVVFEVAFPDHMKTGELRVADPDGYCVLIGQQSRA